MKPTQYQLALTKLHNLIESGEIIPDIENENDGVIAGHSKDGLITFSKDNGYHKINIERIKGVFFLQYNFRVEDEYKTYVLTLAREFK
jgi:hypothetical protein